MVHVSERKKYISHYIRITDFKITKYKDWISALKKIAHHSVSNLKLHYFKYTH